MTGHAATHGLVVALLTGLPWLGVAEAGLHALIDQKKCAGKISLPIDQTLHLLCKGLWVALIAAT